MVECHHVCRRTVMDGERFDLLLKAVATGSRRRMLQGLFGGVLGVTSVGALSTRRAAAAGWCLCMYDCPTDENNIFRCIKQPTKTGEVCRTNSRFIHGEECFSRVLN